MFPFSDSDLKTSSRPYVNWALIAICALVFGYEVIIGSTDQSIFFYKFGVIPNELAHGFDYKILSTMQGNFFDIATPVSNWLTLLTSMFIHGDWLHFLFNMLFLWVFGDNIEDRFGHFRYLLFYLAAGVAAAWLQIAVDSTSMIPTIGASGAIAGVLGAYLLLFPFSRVNTVVIFFFITVIKIPAFILLGTWFVIQFFSGVGSLGLASHGGGVAYWAHIGGFLLGLIVVIIYKRATGQRLWPRGPGGVSGAGPSDVPQYWRGRRL